MCIESVVLSNYLILCHPLLLLASLFPSISVFSKGWALLIKWLKYWSFSFSISPSNEYLRLISLGIDWFDLAVQGTLEFSPTPPFEGNNSLVLSLLSLWSYSHVHTWLWKKSCIWLYGPFSAKWCLWLLIHCLSWLSSKEQASFNFMAAVTVCSDFGAQENKICHCFHFPPIYCYEVMGPNAMILVFLRLSFKPAFSKQRYWVGSWIECIVCGEKSQ